MSENGLRDLSGMAETLLTALYIRAMESQRPDTLIKIGLTLESGPLYCTVLGHSLHLLSCRSRGADPFAHFDNHELRHRNGKNNIPLLNS